MGTVKWSRTLLGLGLVLLTQNLGGHSSAFDGMGSNPARNHRLTAIYYEEQAQLNKRNAEEWDFLANYYERFPAAYSGKMTVADHIARCRAIAEELRKAEQQNRESALQQRSLQRKDFIE